MKKNEIFTFTAPNGAEVTAVVIDSLEIRSLEQTVEYQCWTDKYLCYAQNRLFYYVEYTQIDRVIDKDWESSCGEDIDYYYALEYHSHDVRTTGSFQEILVDYCILPDYDAMLDRYSEIQQAQAETNLGM